MSFGGSIGGGTGGGGSRDVRLMADTAFNIVSTAAMAQPHLNSPPMVQPIFNSSPLSLALKPKTEDLGNLGGLMRDNFDPGMMGRFKEDGFESRSGSDNLEGASGDDQDASGVKALKKKKYHRHTPYQIQELESSFKENPHPDEKARLELGRKLGLENKQVKFWFQNRRTQMKMQLERHENLILKSENDKLRIENYAMKEAMRNPICSTCGGPAILGEISNEQQQLRYENARLRDELHRVCALSDKFLGRPLSSLAGSFAQVVPNSSLELAVGRNGFGCLSSVDATMPSGIDFGNGFSNALHLVPLPRPEIGMDGVPIPFDKSMFVELALVAMDELLKIAQADDHLWLRSFDGVGESLNQEEYSRTFSPCIGMKPNGFVTEATRAMGTVVINSANLVDALMDTNLWAEMFPCLIGRASTIDVIYSGIAGTKDGALQLVYVEHQVLSPLVPVCELKVLRFCKQHAEGVWVVVDVSVNNIREGSNSHTLMNCRRLPSGCIIQDMPNGCSKVTWIEHMEYDESAVHHLYQPLVRSGMGFGAQRWVTTLQRHYESQAVIMSPTPVDDHSGIAGQNGRGNVMKLAQRMTRNFSAAVCATVHTWDVVQIGNVGENVRLMIRGSDNPGEPPGIVLSAATSVWMPESQQTLFDFLRNAQLRGQWDVLSHGAPMEQVACIVKGQDSRNNISLLRASAMGADANLSSMLILQETSTDASGSVLVYAAIDAQTMNGVMNGEDSTRVACLPSGFAVFPDCISDFGVLKNGNGSLAKEGSSSSGGSLLTVVYQILVNTASTAKLTMESVDTVNTLMSRTLQGIKTALNCN